MYPNRGETRRALVTQSDTNPETKLTVDAFRLYRLDNPNWKVLLIRAGVCRSYPRWANIGLTPKVMPLEIPVLILATRRTQEEKQISVIDATNAHFYENVATPEEGIFYDMAEEIRKNIHYAIKCPCPDPSTCTCSDGWTINFVKCKEHPGIMKRYPSVIDDTGVRWMYQLIQLWSFENFIRNENMEAIAPKSWENKDTHEMIAKTKKLNELIDENEVKFHIGGGRGGPFTMDPMLELLDRFEPVSIVHCENCGREETPDCELKRCTRCQKVRYCSRECRDKDWRCHKESCLLPLIDMGGGNKLISFEDTDWDPVAEEWISKGVPEEAPKLERKVKKKKSGRDQNL